MDDRKILCILASITLRGRRAIAHHVTVRSLRLARRLLPVTDTIHLISISHAMVRYLVQI